MTRTIEMPPPRCPRVGESVTYVQSVSGGYTQSPALVLRLYEDRVGPFAAVALLAFQYHRPTSPKVTEYVQHRDHWAEGGGDDFGEYWCWPDEAQPAARYTTPVVTGRPKPSEFATLCDSSPCGLDLQRTPQAAFGAEFTGSTFEVQDQETDRVARLGGQKAQEELDLVADLSTRILSRLEANRHRGGWGGLSLVELCGRLENRSESLVDDTRSYLWELDYGVSGDPRRIQEDARYLERLRDAAADSACYAAMVMQKINLVVARRGDPSVPEPATPIGVLGVTADQVVTDDPGLNSDPTAERRAALTRWFTDLVPGPDEMRRAELTATLEELDKCERESNKLSLAQERCRELVDQLLERRAPAADMIEVLENLSSAEAQHEGFAEQIRELRQKLRTLVPSLSATSFVGLDNPKLTRRLVQLEAALSDSNEILRSLASVVERAGQHTNWDPLAARLSLVLQRQHELMYPEQYEVGPAVGPADPHASPLADEVVGSEFLGSGDE